MHEQENQWSLQPFAVILSLAAVFVADLVFASEVVVAVAYVGAVLLCLWCNRSLGAIVIAVVATAFVILAAVLTNADGLSGAGLANLVLAILAIWAAAVVVMARRQVDDRLTRNLDRTRRLTDQLTEMNFVANSLSRAKSMDDLCRQAATMGHLDLGLGRTSIWFRDGTSNRIRGSFGIGEDGELRDERIRRLDLSANSPIRKVLSRHVNIWHESDTPLCNDLGEQVGIGDHVIAALWDGSEVIGIITCDNLLDTRPFDKNRIQLLELYARTLGHLCSGQQSIETLARSENRLRLVTDALPVCIAHIDADHRYRFLNETGALWFGTTSDKVIRVHVRDVIGAVAYQTIREALEAALAGRQVEMEAEIELRTRGKRFIRALFVPDQSAERSIDAVYSLLLDITHRRQAEKARAQLAAIVEASDDAIISSSVDGRILSWNAGAERVFGYRPEETIGREVNILFPSELKDQFAGLIEKFRQHQHIESFETVRSRKDGQTFNAAVTVSAHRDDGGALIGVSAVVRDITNRKRSEKQLARHREQLRSLTSELCLAEERERRCLAVDLHDDLGQTLALAKMKLELLAGANDTTPNGQLTWISQIDSAVGRTVMCLAA